MAFFRKNKEEQQIIREAKLEQELEDHTKHKISIEKICCQHIELLSKVKLRHANEIENLHDEYREKIKHLSEKRIEQYKQLLLDRDEMIINLKNEREKLIAKVARYREAFEIFRPYRNHLVDMIRTMRGTSSRVRDISAELDQHFGKLDDMASYQDCSAKKLDEKIIKKLGPEEIDLENMVRLIEFDPELEKINYPKK